MTLIVKNIEIRQGKPTILGTRITVMDVLGWLEKDMTKMDIAFYYGLGAEEINACLHYAAVQLQRKWELEKKRREKLDR